MYARPELRSPSCASRLVSSFILLSFYWGATYERNRACIIWLTSQMPSVIRAGPGTRSSTLVSSVGGRGARTEPSPACCLPGCGHWQGAGSEAGGHGLHKGSELNKQLTHCQMPAPVALMHLLPTLVPLGRSFSDLGMEEA